MSAHRHPHRQTKVKTVYPPVSLRSLGGYNKPARVISCAELTGKRIRCIVFN